MNTNSSKHYSNLWYLLRYLLKYKGILFAVLLFLSLTVISILYIGINIRYFTNNALDSTAFLEHATKLFLVLLLVLAVASALRSYFIEMLCSKTCNDIRYALYNNLLYTQPQKLEAFHKNHLPSILSNDLPVIHTIIQTIFSFFIRNFLMLIGGIVMIFKINLYLTLSMIIVVPIVLSPIILMGRRLKYLASSHQSTLAEISIKTQEGTSALKEIQANCQEKNESRNFRTILTKLCERNEEKFRYRSILVGLVILVVSYSVMGIFWLGSYQIIIHSIKPGDLVSFVFYAVIVVSTLSGMSEVYSDVNKAAAAADKITECLNSNISQLTATKPLKPSNNYSIVFDNVSFGYQERLPNLVLQNINLIINPGQRIGIVGRSGTGKSTLLQLILGFYTPNSGVLSLAQQNISSIKPDDLRSILSYVSQDPYIFPISVEDNIKYGNHSVSHSQIIKIMKALDMHDFIANLPNGYNTVLDSRGDNLSGGQKQRIAIARAMLRQSKILLFDEITSFVDKKNEDAICNLLSEDQRTMVIVSHKPQILSLCQQVIELKKRTLIHP